MNAISNITKHYHTIIELLNAVPFNTLFAEAVVKQKIKGKIFTDNVSDSRTFYILHPYGMSLLVGDTSNSTFNSCFKEYVQNLRRTRTKVEWMQVYPNNWHLLLKELFNDNSNSIEIDSRVNFKFNVKRYLENKKDQPHIEIDVKISPTETNDYLDMNGTVIPGYFWNNPNDFICNGIGYSLFYQNKLAALAFSAFIDDKYLELGIETQEQYRGKNFAYEVCSALINYCMEKNLEPVWACRRTNIGSYKLAKKLGFEEVLETPFYKLNY